MLDLKNSVLPHLLFYATLKTKRHKYAHNTLLEVTLAKINDVLFNQGKMTSLERLKVVNFSVCTLCMSQIMYVIVSSW